MFQSKNHHIKDKLFAASFFMIRVIAISLFVVVLLESSLHYRRKQPEPTTTYLSIQKPVVHQYNFTNDDGEENTLVVMS